MTATVSEFPMTLPSLNIAVLRLPVPMSEEDFQALMGALAGMKKALIREDESPEPESVTP